MLNPLNLLIVINIEYELCILMDHIIYNQTNQSQHLFT